MTHDPLDLLVVLSETNLRGCRAVPDYVSADDLFGAWSALSGMPKGTWADRAFRQGVDRPCDGLPKPADPFDVDRKPRLMRCDPDRCLFAPAVEL